MIGDYAELQAAIAGWLKRTNLTDRIPDFITLAEAQLNRDLRTRQMFATYRRNTDQNIISLPDDYLDAEKLELNGNELLYTPRWTESSSQLQQGGPYMPYAQGSPYITAAAAQQYYTIIGNSVWIRAVMNGMQLFTLYYYTRLTPLSDAEPQNWLIEDAPDAYLYGSLMQAEPYLKNDARTALWAGLYKGIVEQMNANNARARSSGSALTARAG
jgi:hypothetical protein